MALLALMEPPQRETVVTTVTITEAEVPSASETVPEVEVAEVVHPEAEKPEFEAPEIDERRSSRVTAVAERQSGRVPDRPEPEPEPEEEPEPVVAEFVPAEAMRSVFQPDRGEEAPDEPTALAEFDNSTDVETMPEDLAVQVEDAGQNQLEEGGDPETEEAEEQSAELDDDPVEGEDEARVAEFRETALGDDDGEAEFNDEGAIAQEAREAQPAVEPVADARPEPEMLVDGAGPTRSDSPLDMFRPQAALEVAERLAAEGRLAAVVRGTDDGADGAAYHEVFGERDARDGARVARAERENSVAGNHDEIWDRTRQALENYDVAVTPGSELSLNTRSDAAAAYIHYLHNRIHDRWWAYLDQWTLHAGADSPLSDFSLVAVLEFGIDRDGEVDRVSIADGSGNLQFDGSAVSLLWDISPHQPPPPGLLGSDGNVYVRWSFHRDNRGCISSGASVRRVQSSEGEGG